tara:strand:+ start:17773 stop:22368 length:4596 start_codon:yes stop_codon:yes gene_type:complete
MFTRNHAQTETIINELGLREDNSDGTKSVKVKGVHYVDPADGTPDDDTPRYMTLAKAVVVDLISEDGIEGLVTHEYDFDQNKSKKGLIGYAGATVRQLNTDTNLAKLASIYWNKTPILDHHNGKFNFADINVITDQNAVRTSGLGSSKVRSINERIRGQDGGTEANDKFYQVINKYCDKIVVGVKVGRLGRVDRYKGTAKKPNENYGELLDSAVHISFFYRPLFSNRKVDFISDYTEVIRGSFSTPYTRDYFLNLTDAYKNYGSDEGFIGWEIKIIRNTPEPTNPDVVNETIIDTITEYTSCSLMYPQSFVIKNSFDADTFSQLPERIYDVRLQKVRIPSNYDPVTRTYWSTWNGTFSDEVTGTDVQYGKSCTDWENQTGCQAIGNNRAKGLYWTDNPAWCFYDLLTNKRYGLGKYIDEINIDKWTLYEIAQYCDELVPDGNGGLEPRFSCNVFIGSREDAYQVLNDMASVFRSMIYYQSGSIYVVQDSKKQPLFLFNNSNVENGDFNYTTTSKRVRHTVAVVRYNDKDNFYQPDVEYVDDADGIRRYGIKEKDITAFGCTSRGQARRLGQWILNTEKMETETVAFTTGMEGSMLRPGDVFTVADSNRLIKRRGGRVNTFTKNTNSQFTILLDGDLEALDANRDYELTISAPSFFYDSSQVDMSNPETFGEADAQFIRNKHVQKFTITNSDVTYNSNGSGKSLITINCSNCINDSATLINGVGSITDNMSWSILGVGVATQNNVDIQEKQNQNKLYRAINIVEKEVNKYEVSGVEYTEEKYENIDSSLAYTNQLNLNIPKTPHKLTITSVTSPTGAPNTKEINYSIEESEETDGLKGLSYYAVYAKKDAFGSSAVPDDQYLVDKIYSTGTPSGTFIPSVDGTYHLRVYAVNALNQYSSGTNNGYREASRAVTGVNPIRDVKITSLRISDNTLKNAEASSDPFNVDEGVDEYDDSAVQFLWNTSIPTVQNINTSFDFKFRVRIYEGHTKDFEESKLRGDFPDFLPPDWDLGSTSFEFNLIENMLTTLDDNNNFRLEKALRKYTIRVDAVDAAGNLSSAGSSDTGYDYLWVDNPQPAIPDPGCVITRDNNDNYVSASDECIQTFIDLNNNVKIYNTGRPSDVSAVYIIAAKQEFTYQQFLDNAFDDQDDIWDFNIVKISDIGNTDPVFEIAPSFGRQGVQGQPIKDLLQCWVAIAYTDQFDEDVDLWQKTNMGSAGVSNYDIRKRLADRISKTVRASKVTPDIIDLLGEGWKAWIKIDHNGNWYGNKIKCIKDVTSEYSSYKGYLPFYCSHKTPLITWVNGNPTSGNSDATSVYLWPAGSGSFPMYTAGCQYYLTNWNDSSTQPKTPVNNITKKGGYVTGDEATTIAQQVDDDERGPGYNQEIFQKGFKRYRVYFEKPKNPENYWVVGMNCNHKAYYNGTLLENIGALWKHSPSEPGSAPDFEDQFDAQARKALNAAQVRADELVMIGGSDAYFNFHPAGFVQGFGGLPKTEDYFDIHMGHMIDNSYLREAVFFVMASTQEVKTPNSNCPNIV